MCANVDMYSGFVYKCSTARSLYMLFATARIVGWMAHRLEEVTTGGKIIRPCISLLRRISSTFIDERNDGPIND
ncbi:MAG: citrate/2-methylcitrate synthase [Butyricicoccus sp.]